jgi:hypothetical protein
LVARKSTRVRWFETFPVSRSKSSAVIFMPMESFKYTRYVF